MPAEKLSLSECKLKLETSYPADYFAFILEVMKAYDSDPDFHGFVDRTLEWIENLDPNSRIKLSQENDDSPLKVDSFLPCPHPDIIL